MADAEHPRSPQRARASEERLEQIRKEAADTGRVVSGAGAAIASTGSPPPGTHSSAESYYNLPVLKPPTWTWEVPLYFFFGGIAGVSAVITLFAQIAGRDPSLVRVALWMALGGAGICPPLLISDLGRPSRFLNMLRVFKWRSPMSMGSWVLVAFSGCAFFAVAANELAIAGYAVEWMHLLRWPAEIAGAITGLLLAIYTGVLLGATAIPVWNQHRHLLPGHFLTSGLGGAAALLELFGFLVPATQILGFAASGIETLIGFVLELKHTPVDAPLHHGRSGWLMRIAGTLEGPVSLVVRIVWGGSATGRYAAAICFLLGALASRYAWIWAGRASAHDPKALFWLQRSGMKQRAAKVSA